MMTNDESTIIFMTPGAGTYKLYAKNAYFLSSFSLLWDMEKTNQLSVIDDQVKIYQYCKYHDPLGQGF